MQWFEEKDFSSITIKAIDSALIAGAILKEGYTKSFKIEKKSGTHNLVTEYDYLAEKTIIENIKKDFSDHSILSEEKGLEQTSSNIQWIIDPLDGTVNFAHSIPAFAVSIGVKQKDEIISGVIYYPLREELFIAEKNKGAYLNNQKLQVSNTKSLKDAFVATGFPYDLKNNPNFCQERFIKVLKKGIPIRRIGVASIDLAYVASGRFDLFWESSLGAWDIAAGVLMIEEAMGKVTTFDNKKVTFQNKNAIIASNKYLHDEFLKTIEIS